MPYSKFNSDLTFDENQWVVSLINTQTGIRNIFGGHAKIVVEGVRRTGNGLMETELFIGEYHIMEREGMNNLVTDTWIPQVFRNTVSRYSIIVTERNDYSARQEQQYSEVWARSCGGLNPTDVMRMIRDIKREDNNINQGAINPQFQYAGKWSFYGIDNAHNCTSWTEEKLEIIGQGVSKHLITDSSSKTSPFLHVNSSSNSDVTWQRVKNCVLL